MGKSIFLIVFISLFSFLHAKISVGEIIALDGNATVIRDSKNLNVKIGFELFKKDIINTAKESKVQLLFNDNTSVSIGNNSTMKVSEYIFDDKNNSKVQLDFKTGVFKTITGKIGKLAPSKFKLKTKTSTIGIRGTKIVVFTGKGVDKISCTGGAINVRNLLGNVTVRKGFQTTVNKNKAPQKPKKYTKKDFQNMEKRFEIKKKKVKTSTTGPMMLESTKKLSLTTMKDQKDIKNPKAGQDQKLSRTPTINSNLKPIQPTKIEVPLRNDLRKTTPVVNPSLNADLKLLDNTLKKDPVITPKISPQTVGNSLPRASGLQPIATSKSDPIKIDAVKVNTPKLEPISAPKIEAPKVIVPKIEAPKIEAPKIEAPKVIVPKIEAPKVEPITSPKIDLKATTYR